MALIATIEIPIYRTGVEIYDSCNDIGFDDKTTVGGLEWDWDRPNTDVPKMAFNLNHHEFNIGTVAHECAHLVFRIFGNRGVVANPDNDEHFCYLLEFVMNAVSKVIIEHQKKQKDKKETK